MIQEIIKDINERMKESPNELYIRLVNERLDKSLQNYYKDITSLTMSYDNWISDNKSIRAYNKILK